MKLIFYYFLTISYIFYWPQEVDLEFELEWQEDNLLNPTQIMQSGKEVLFHPEL